MNSTAIARLVSGVYTNFDITQSAGFQKSPLVTILNNAGIITYLANKISNNALGLFSFSVLEPIAPKGYKALGHIFVSQTDDLKAIKANTCVACVPESCVKEVRDWKMSDMVFEYRSGNNYFNIFYNPYIGTFIAGTQNGVPAGKVCKVVACVKPCSVVDEIIKADKCARDFQAMNKTIAKENNLASMLSADEEDTYYLNKIAEQSQRIAMMKAKAGQMQIEADKADIVNREYNKSRMQNLVDTQQRNIGIVMGRMEKDKNTVDVDVKIPLETINQITKAIYNSTNIPSDVKKNMLETITKNKTLADNGVITGDVYRQNMNKLLKTCQDYDLSEFVRKDMASQVCYGCTEPV
jgi:hypothetical protein